LGGCFPSPQEIGVALTSWLGPLVSSIDVLISGNALGADRCGEIWAKACGIPIQRYPAKWIGPDGRLDRGAGFRRNAEMAELLTPTDIALGFWDGVSRGTKDMERRCKVSGAQTRVVLWREGQS
jgi:hypothetical protein